MGYTVGNRRSPGIGATRTAEVRAILLSDRGSQHIIGGGLVKGADSRDPGNTSYVHVLRAGLPMGKQTSGGLWAPSIYGLTTNAVGNADTSNTLAAGIITEIARRKGASGTVKFTGPPTAGGTVRTLTVTYSAASGTTLTFTALGVNEVQTLNFTNTPSGTFRIKVKDLNGVWQVTQPITYSGTAATLVSNINTALDAVLGAGLVVASGSAVTAIAITFSGAGYAALPQELISLDTDALTAGDWDLTRTTTGVDGRFAAGSWVQPVDGSETILALLDHPHGLRVTDEDGVSVDSEASQLLVAGQLDVDQVINYSSDASMKAYFKAALRAKGYAWRFSDDD